MPSGRTFPASRFSLPPDFRLEDTLAYLGRDPGNVCERVTGTRFEKARPDGTLFFFEVRGSEVECNDEGVSRRLLGLHVDPAPFEAAFPELAAPRKGLRIPLSANPFEALAWTIVGQQINLRFAYVLRNNLIRACKTVSCQGLLAHPTPGQLAALDPEELRLLKFSQRKAEYVIGMARRVAEGALPLDEMAGWEPERVAEVLLRERGIGPWSVQYFMMRGLGFVDCAPIGDSALHAALGGVDARRAAELMEKYRPYRSLATFHLWRS